MKLTKTKKEKKIQIRLPDCIQDDLDFICSRFGISTEEWIKVKLATMIIRNKENILKKYGDDYLSGKLDEKEYAKLSGQAPSKKLAYEKMSFELSAKKYLKQALKETM